MDINRICLCCMDGERGPEQICPVCGCGPLVKQEPPYALQPESIVHGRYLVGRVLGQGGFGITYLAYDLVNNQKVVLKELFPTMMVRRVPGATEVSVHKDPDFFYKCRQRFVDEARIIYSFRDIPEIVDVYHAFIENNTGYYSMEFLNGQTLQSKLKHEKRAMTWEELLPVVSETGAALRAVHRKGSIHRDISPDNIFILHNGVVKLIDFGAARQYGNGKGFTEILKKGFAPYEQYQREGNQGPWTDLYSLAATLYYCLTRKMVPEALSRVMNDSIKLPSQYGAVLSKEVEKALMQALNVKSEFRFSSVDAFMNALGVQLRPLLPSEANPHFEAVQPTGALHWYIRGIRGDYAGQKFYFNDVFVVGRDPSKCNLVFPQGSPGVSRVHMSFIPAEDGTLILRCESASQLIYVNGNPLGGQGNSVRLRLGDRFSFGINQIFVLERS